MELLEGQTLAQMIDRHHRFDLTHLLDIAMQITMRWSRHTPRASSTVTSSRPTSFSVHDAR
jgi:hypothetical protein